MTHTSTHHAEGKAQSSSALSSMQECIDICFECAETCNATLSNCLEMGGLHVQGDHLKTLIACSEICTLTANWMARDFDFHASLCRSCAEICKACAKSCEDIGADEVMKECIEVCLRCADSCDKMAAH
jgi:hypothetical protein